MPLQFLDSITYGESEVDIPLQNTYFVTSPLIVCTEIFLFFAFVIYLFRQLLNKFRGVLPNTILFLAALISFILIRNSVFTTLLLPAQNYGWTIVPPNGQVPLVKENDTFANASYAVYLLQIILIFTVAFAGFRIYKNMVNSNKLQ